MGTGTQGWTWVIVALFALVAILVARRSCGRQMAHLYDIFDKPHKTKKTPKNLDQGLPGTSLPDAGKGRLTE